MVHRDIRLENVMCDAVTGDYKLIDFGLSRKLAPGKKFTETISPHFTAPEILDGRFASKCDMWAIGVLCYRLVSGRYPFQGKNTQEICYAIHKGQYSFRDGD